MCVYLLLFDCALTLHIDRLGDRNYTRRECAHRQLSAWGRLAVPYLQRAEHHPDPEVQRRAAILLAPYDTELADLRSHLLKPTSWPRRPWLSGCPGPLTHYLSEARRYVPSTGPPEWPEYREATRLWVRSLLLQRRPLDEIILELDRMAAEERWWILQYGANYNPPLKVPQ
jgi:hypothetical protein